MALGKDSDRLRTMLQKFYKCEVKAHSAGIQEINFHQILCEISFGKIWITKIGFFTILDSLDFELWVNLRLEKLLKFTNIQNLNLWIYQKWQFLPFELAKIWFHV